MTTGGESHEWTSPAGSEATLQEERKTALRAPKTGFVVLAVSLTLMILLAFVSWGGMFKPVQLALVIAGSVIFTAAGVLVLSRSRSLMGAAFGWIIALVLLCVPLVVGVGAMGSAQAVTAIIFAGIAMWVSGIAVVALIAAVVCVVLHSRTLD